MAATVILMLVTSISGICIATTLVVALALLLCQIFEWQPS
jgi:hypothetical protein